jgi:predicted dehydrogenase
VETVCVGVIGCGGRGKGHIRILNGFEDVDLVAVCDPVVEIRDAVCAEFGVDGQYGEIPAMLDDANLDAVVVAPPAHLNAELALPCLERGVHTLLEKPPGLCVAETEGLKAAADRSGAKAMVGWNRRFHPVIVQARDMVLDCGPITQLVGEFHKSITDHEKNEKMAEVIMDQLLFETPIHAIDTIRFLADSDVAEVHSVVRRSMSKYRDVHAALIEFENGTVAQVSHNYTTSARLERYEIHGYEISAYMEGVKSGQVFFDGEIRELSDTGASTDDQDRFFIDCVKEDRPITLPAANLEEAIKTMRLCEDIMEGTR